MEALKTCARLVSKAAAWLQGGQAEMGSAKPAPAAAGAAHASMPFLQTSSADGGPDAINWSLTGSNGKLNFGFILFCVLCAACIGMLAMGPIVRLLRPRQVCQFVRWL